MAATLLFDLFPGHKLHLALFHNVSNSTELTGVGTTAGAAFLDARLVVGRLAVQTAANKALHEQSIGKMACRNLETQLVYNMSITTSIDKSLAIFAANKGGSGVSTDRVLVAVFEGVSGSGLDEDAMQRVAGLVKGDAVALELLDTVHRPEPDEAALREAYKIGSGELGGVSVEAIVTRIATKGIVKQ